MKKIIRICTNCGCPLIWTFRWAYKERFCMNCGLTGGMMGTGKDVELTPELKLKQRVINKIWSALYSKKNHLLLPIARYKRTGCKKCEAGDDHNEHLTNREIRNGKIAERVLKSMQGIFKHDLTYLDEQPERREK